MFSFLQTSWKHMFFTSEWVTSRLDSLIVTVAVEIFLDESGAYTVGQARQNEVENYAE